MPRFLIVILVLLSALSASANDVTRFSMQSGSPGGGTPLHDRGLRGEGQVIAILDTGLDYDSCYFAEADGSPPPLNIGLSSSNVDPRRRKVIAYNFLYACAEYPGSRGCENPLDRGAFDNQGHGTHAAGAAAGDKGAFGAYDYADAIAPAAKLVVQDAGFIGGDNCSQRPGLGCPLRDLRPLFAQAYAQGARIHSNSWGDRQGASAFQLPPTGNYSPGASQIDEFVFSHPDMVVIFNSGNAGSLGATSLSAPGVAKNAIQVGGTRIPERGDDVVAGFSGFGPTRDGRIKPDLVGPANVTAGDSDFDVNSRNCTFSLQPGTSWAAPTIAGAAALTRQYYTEGFYPSGERNAAGSFNPSAALIKATLIAAARRVPFREQNNQLRQSLPVPSFEQGYGFPVLDDALHFRGESTRLKIYDGVEVSAVGGFSTTLLVAAGKPLRVVLVWTDPPSAPRSATDSRPVLINDLDLRVTNTAGVARLGNDTVGGGVADRLNNVELVNIAAAEEGGYQIEVSGSRLAATTAQRFALVIVGEFREVRTRGARR